MIIIIILSSNGMSCHMIMFHTNNMQLLLSLYDVKFKFLNTNRNFTICL